MKALIPVVLAVLGLIGGLAGGHFLAPAAEKDAMEHASKDGGQDASASHGDGMSKDHAGSGYGSGGSSKMSNGGYGGAHDASGEAVLTPIPEYDAEKKYDYVKLDKQFVVPLVVEDTVSALIILAVSLEVDPGTSEIIYSKEPKIRDMFLQILFRHAQSGAFQGSFTSERMMRDLRNSLRAAAQSVVGPTAHDVLVTELIRQDL